MNHAHVYISKRNKNFQGCRIGHRSRLCLKVFGWEDHVYRVYTVEK